MTVHSVPRTRLYICSILATVSPVVTADRIQIHFTHLLFCFDRGFPLEQTVNNEQLTIANETQSTTVIMIIITAMHSYTSSYYGITITKIIIIIMLQCHVYRVQSRISGHKPRQHSQR